MNRHSRLFSCSTAERQQLSVPSANICEAVPVYTIYQFDYINVLQQAFLHNGRNIHVLADHDCWRVEYIV